MYDVDVESTAPTTLLYSILLCPTPTAFYTY